LETTNKFKYATYTDKIYKIVFLENAKEYKQILDLGKKDKLRETLYSEVLNIIASIENGIAHEMRNESENLGRKLISKELNELFKQVKNNPYLKPIIEDARERLMMIYFWILLPLLFMKMNLMNLLSYDYLKLWHFRISHFFNISSLLQ
jgi:hypothetical protein